MDMAPRRPRRLRLRTLLDKFFPDEELEMLIVFHQEIRSFLYLPVTTYLP
jgi:hypothetical protein